jgi:hypothetical protein
VTETVEALLGVPASVGVTTNAGEYFINLLGFVVLPQADNEHDGYFDNLKGSWRATVLS